jgi:hypothetical protein
MHIQWASKIDQVLKKYLSPLRHLVNLYMRDDGKLGYYQLWRALKSVNIKTFNIDSRDIENVIIKVLKLKDKAAAKRNGDGEKGVKDADMS